MKRITRILILSLIALTVIAVPVLAAAYQAILTVTETGGNDYDMLPIMVTSPNKFMAENDFMDADALDTRVETLGGLEYPHMVADDRTNTVLELLANSQQNLFFTTGNTPLTDFAIILGQGGYFTVNDTVALELGDDFSLLIEDTYIDTSVADVIAEKPGAFSWTTDGAGNVVSSILDSSPTNSNFLPTGDGSTIELSPGTNNYIRVSDGSTGTFNSTNSYMSYKTDLYTFSISNLGYAINSITLNWTWIGTYPAGAYCKYTIKIDDTTYTGSEIYQLYTAGNVDKTQTLTTSPATGTAWSWDELASIEAGLQMKAVSGCEGRLSKYSITVSYAVPFTALTLSTAVPSGYYDTLELIADGTDLNLDLDGVTVDTVALAGASVPDNANDWQIMSAAVPYMGSFTFEVGGATVAEYNPTDIVRGSTYDTGTVTVTNGDATVVGNATVWTSDMEGSAFVSADGYHYVVDSVTDATHLELSIVYAGGTLGAQSYDMYPCLQNETTADAHVGAITWGANPADTAAVLGSMVSTSQAFPGSVEDRDTRDILPDGGTGDWFVEPAVGAALLTNPLRPFVTILSGTTTLTERQAWVLLGLVFVIMVLIFTAKVVKGHYIITGVATGAAVLACTVFTIFPVWALVFVALAVGAGFIAERSPSL